MQQFQPLRLKLSEQHCDAGSIAAWAVEARNETGLNRVAPHLENDRNSAACGFGCTCWCQTSYRSDNRYPALDQISRQFRQACDVVSAIAVFDDNVSALGK